MSLLSNVSIIYTVCKIYLGSSFDIKSNKNLGY